MNRSDPDPELVAAVRAAGFVIELFDRIPDVVFFVKDLEGRYVAVNRTLVERCGLGSWSELVGRTTRELFPEPLGELFLAQDRAVCEAGSAIRDQLELHLYPDGSQGWCLTDKVPIRGEDRRVIGLVGFSRDLHATLDTDPELAGIARAVAALQADPGEAKRVDELAGVAGLSAYQLNRRLRRLFHITAGQLIVKARLDAATRLLATTDRSIADIAAECGYSDQSAFTRQFRTFIGLPPSRYRELQRPRSESP